MEVENLETSSGLCYSSYSGYASLYGFKDRKEAQEGVMEFLLINHPLDCPTIKGENVSYKTVRWLWKVELEFQGGEKGCFS